MKVPFNYLDRQFDETNTREILEKLAALARTGDFTIGAPVREFEERVAAFCSAKYAIGVNSGTDALILALRSFGIGTGAEVIVQANTFYATAGAIVAVGARPVFVDVDDTYMIDVAAVRRALTPRTKAIIPVWWTGCAPDLETLKEIEIDAGLVLIEDACPAFGATASPLQEPPGAFGRAAAFSLHPLKQLHVWGDGGIVITNDDQVAEWLRLYRNHGLSGRDTMAIWGVNQRLQSVQAVIANHELSRVPDAIDRRNVIAAILDERLGKIPEIIIPPRNPDNRHAFQIYVIRTQRRDELLAYLQSQGIDAKVHYPTPLHLQPPGRAMGWKEGDCPRAEQQAKEILTLPCNQFLTDEEVAYMIEQVEGFYRQ